MMRILKNLLYIKRKYGLRNYYHYLKLKKLSNDFGIIIPSYEETLEGLKILSTAINKAGISINKIMK